MLTRARSQSPQGAAASAAVSHFVSSPARHPFSHNVSPAPEEPSLQGGGTPRSPQEARFPSQPFLPSPSHPIPPRLITALSSLLLLFLVPAASHAADLKPDPSSTIPADATRPLIIQLTAPEAAKLKESTTPKASLPEGWELTTATAVPLVTHPIMGCLDDQGRLFLGDAVGLNWNKAQLEASPPNRVLMLEDTDQDGFFEKSTVFADKMTFPQGAVWLKGSLYVASPPGIWKLTDTDQDGVADQREMIVGGFDYTGNAADVHGPFLHPNGRLYWCHGRKGHKVLQKDGSPVHEGLASGIWSCQPDGSDIQWHSLGCADNPTEIDFTPDGEIIGTCTLYHSQPRGDTLMHWLHGGVYERPDMMKAIQGLPRTLEHMPVLHNFGHVAVSGCTFARRGPDYPHGRNGDDPGILDLYVTHFNTQRVVRMSLTPSGASYRATEHEFLSLPDAPDVHFTDVMEDARGDLLVVNTGGWFRIGCPSSLMAKPDVKGAVYRVRRANAGGPLASREKRTRPWKASWELQSDADALAQLSSRSDRALVQVCDWAAATQTKNPEVRGRVLQLLKIAKRDPVLDHAAMHAVQRLYENGGFFFSEPADDDFSSRHLLILAQRGVARLTEEALVSSAKNLDAGRFPQLTSAIRRVACDTPNGGGLLLPAMTEWLAEKPLSPAKLEVVAEVISAHLAAPSMQTLLVTLLTHEDLSARREAWRMLSTQTAGITHEAWLEPLARGLGSASPSDVPLLIDAVAKLKTSRFDTTLLALVNDDKRSQTIRLKALAAVSRGGRPLDAGGFRLLTQLLSDATSVTARLEAARILASVSLTTGQLRELAAVIPTLGPLEIQEMLKLVRKTKDEALIKELAAAFAKSPVIGSIEESAFKTAFASTLPAAYDIVAPAIRAAAAATEAKKRRLESLAALVASKGRAGEGKALFAAGKGTCLACHKIGETGRALGPDLSKIGAIRIERDLLESILFPSNTLARDYEAHAIETSDGQQLMGLIRSHTAEGLLLVDLAGQEKSVPHASIVANTTLTTSLMPMGLDATMSEQELCDLVAWLRSLK